jgi:hypothetical protein
MTHITPKSSSPLHTGIELVCMQKQTDKDFWQLAHHLSEMATDDTINKQLLLDSLDSVMDNYKNLHVKRHRIAELQKEVQKERSRWASSTDETVVDKQQKKTLQSLGPLQPEAISWVDTTLLSLPKDNKVYLQLHWYQQTANGTQQLWTVQDQRLNLFSQSDFADLNIMDPGSIEIHWNAEDKFEQLEPTFEAIEKQLEWIDAASQKSKHRLNKEAGAGPVFWQDTASALTKLLKHISEECTAILETSTEAFITNMQRHLQNITDSSSVNDMEMTFAYAMEAGRDQKLVVKRCLLLQSRLTHIEVPETIMSIDAEIQNLNCLIEGNRQMCSPETQARWTGAINDVYMNQKTDAILSGESLYMICNNLQETNADRSRP